MGCSTVQGLFVPCSSDTFESPSRVMGGGLLATALKSLMSLSFEQQLLCKMGAK